ncbi:DUF2975 domain-containing protein [Aestuariivivens insulae]|uniref:DUF2975 domain-containing protein n=1 Tax=Aestuariivivens insulae TaxID=1621988 RepID=UPI001F595A8E|nr:DUF2975 domain-containing protein [Aestuariivivens insulae]
MKKLKLLKLITDIIYYLNIILITISPIVAFAVIITINSEGLEYKGKEYTNIGAGLIFSYLLKYLVYLALVYCLYLFRKIILFFLELKIFDNMVINLFNKIGKYLILIGFGFIISSCIPIDYNYTTYHSGGFTNHYKHEYNFQLNFIWIAIGLFFQVLSEVLSSANELKQENDLTI